MDVWVQIPPLALFTKMTEALYQKDSYLKEWMAEILEVIPDKENKNCCFLVLDKTAFYAQGGGQPFDTGELISGDKHARVLSVKKAEGKILA